METLEIKEIDIPSPVNELNIGDDFIYEGEYVHGYEKGTSKIKRFYKEVAFWDGVERKLRKGDSWPVWFELENDKLQLLGFLGYKNKLVLNNKFKKLTIKTEVFDPYDLTTYDNQVTRPMPFGELALMFHRFKIMMEEEPNRCTPEEFIQGENHRRGIFPNK